MHVHPSIAALRSDFAPQRRAQAAMKAAIESWRAEPGIDQFMTQFAAFGHGAALEDCPDLEAVFTQTGEASRLMHLMSRHFIRAFTAHPLGQPPFRNGFDGNAGSMLLARAGRAQLIVQAREPARLEHAGYVFTDALRYDAVIGGKADARIVRIIENGTPTVGFSEERLMLEPGCQMAFDLASEALLIDHVEERLVMLRLVRNRTNPGPMREFDAATGTMQQQSAGTIATSRQEAIIALLGRMQRTEAAPCFAQVALDEGDTSLRWQAVRECLALDSEEGFRALSRIALRAGDPLAGSAGALRAQLLENYPEFLQMEAEQCPA